MIYPTDLRIGNLVYNPKKKLIGRVIVIFLKNGSYCVEIVYLDGHPDDDSIISEAFNCIDIEGIPLSEDWLRRFGFLENRKDGHLFSKGGYDVITWQTGKIDFIKDDFEIMGELKFIHQIQNLFYTLTFKEVDNDERKWQANMEILGMDKNKL